MLMVESPRICGTSMFNTQPELLPDVQYSTQHRQIVIIRPFSNVQHCAKTTCNAEYHATVHALSELPFANSAKRVKHLTKDHPIFNSTWLKRNLAAFHQSEEQHNTGFAHPRRSAKGDISSSVHLTVTRFRWVPWQAPPVRRTLGGHYAETFQNTQRAIYAPSHIDRAPSSSRPSPRSLPVSQLPFILAINRLSTRLSPLH